MKKYSKRNSKDTLLRRIRDLEWMLNKVYEAGLDGICYVGQANYASRESEAIQKLEKAMEADPDTVR